MLSLQVPLSESQIWTSDVDRNLRMAWKMYFTPAHPWPVWNIYTLTKTSPFLGCPISKIDLVYPTRKRFANTGHAAITVMSVCMRKSLLLLMLLFAIMWSNLPLYQKNYDTQYKLSYVLSGVYRSLRLVIHEAENNWKAGDKRGEQWQVVISEKEGKAQGKLWLASLLVDYTEMVTKSMLWSSIYFSHKVCCKGSAVAIQETRALSQVQWLC